MLLALFLVLNLGSLEAAAGSRLEEPYLLVLKTGETHAASPRAREVLESFTRYVAAAAAGELPLLQVAVTAAPAQAVKILDERKPDFAIVTPAFFLEHEKARKLTPLLVAPRRGIQAEQYVMWVRKGTASTLRGRDRLVVHTTLADEAVYLERVVLEGWSGARIEWSGTANLSDSLLALAWDDPEAPDGVLVDRVSRSFFEEDPDVGPEVEALFTSPPLLTDLVVSCERGRARASRLESVLLGMKEVEEGVAVLKAMQLVEFRALPTDRLQHERLRYRPARDDDDEDEE